jgi:hypothetical protein
MITSEARPGTRGAERVRRRPARRASRDARRSGHAVRSLCVFAAAACSVALASACASHGPAPRVAATLSPKPPATGDPVHGASPSGPPGGASASHAPSTATRPWREPKLTAIRMAGYGTYDRAVFQFANGVPRYRVSYVPAVVQDAKGTQVPLPGRSFLRVTFHPATETGTLPTGPPQNTGPGVVSPYFPTLLQVSAAGDFEGHLSFGLGLSGRGGYRVYTLTNPGRVVIDLPHVALPKFPGIWDITSWRQFWEAQTAVENGHQPWLGSPPMVVRAWATGFSSRPTIHQIGPDTFQVTDPTDSVRPRMAIVSGTRPVITGQAQLWVITSIGLTPN